MMAIMLAPEWEKEAGRTFLGPEVHFGKRRAVAHDRKGADFHC
jgi:hypothetical protein